MQEKNSAETLVHSPGYKLVRFIMIHLRKLSRCPLVDRFYLDRGLVRSTFAKETSLMTFSDSYHETAIRSGAWANVLYAAFLFSSLHMGLSIFHSYKFDLISMHYSYLVGRRRLGDFQSCQHVTRSNVGQVLRNLNETMEHERKWTNLLGRPGRVKVFSVSCLMGLFMWSIVSYLLPQFYTRLLRPFDQYILRILIDYERELELCQLLIQEQVDEFLLSHRNSIKQIVVLQVTADDQLDEPKRERAIDKARATLGQDKFIERELLNMKRRNELLPINRRPEWIQTWLRYYLMGSLMLIGFSSVVAVTIIVLLFFSPLLRPSDDYLNYTLADWLVILELCVFLLTLCSSVSFYGATSMFSCTDQLRLAIELRKLHEQFITKSQQTFDFSASDMARFRRELNCGLLRLMMVFRIFSKQLASQRRVEGSHALTLVILLFLLPIMNCVNSPYFDTRNLGVIIFTAVASLTTLVAVSAGLLGPCEIYNRCLHLHRSRAKLLAHIIQIDQVHPNFYNSHLVERLRRETRSNQGQLGEEFATVMAGFQFTYSTVIRLYFWFGALILFSIIRPNALPTGESDNPAADDLMIAAGSDPQMAPGRRGILEDPFRIFKC